MLKQGREILKRGTADLPIEFYEVDEKHPRYEMPHHWHDDVEFLYIRKGHFELVIDGKTRLLGANDFILIAPNCIHGGIPHHCIYECILIQASLFHSLPDLSISLIKNSFQLVKQETHFYYNELVKILKEKKNLYKISALGVLCQLLGFVMEESNSQKIDKKIISTDTKMKEVFAYIYHHFSEKITLEQLASIAGFTSHYFCEYFFRITGKSPIEYVNYYRIEKAIEYLSYQRYSITETAYFCGFSDVSYFIRVFKKFRNITPRQYILNSNNLQSSI